MLPSFEIYLANCPDNLRAAGVTPPDFADDGLFLLGMSVFVEGVVGSAEG